MQYPHFVVFENDDVDILCIRADVRQVWYKIQNVFRKNSMGYDFFCRQKFNQRLRPATKTRSIMTFEAFPETVIIVGAGVFGLSTALEISRKYPGTQVTVIDRQTPPVVDGTSVDTSRIIRPGKFFDRSIIEPTSSD